MSSNIYWNNLHKSPWSLNVYSLIQTSKIVALPGAAAWNNGTVIHLSVHHLAYGIIKKQHNMNMYFIFLL